MAGTVVVTSDTVFGETWGKGYSREILLTCTADASAHTYPSTELVAMVDAAFSITKGRTLQGWGLWMIETDPGATGPTDDTDFVLNSANGTDMLGGNGANAIDNATNNIVYPPVSPMFIGPSITLVISNNAVNSAIVYIKLYLVRG